MVFQDGTEGDKKPTAEEESPFWAEQLATYLAPSHQRLDASLDQRVVGNLTATMAGIVQTRTELKTSALGSAICGPAHAEAGTQRLQRAFQHQGWESEVIEEVLWEQAEMSRKQMQQRGETPLCIWVSLVLEKPESEKLEGLGAVRSSRVRRLARRRKGVFNQPSRMPVSVRGFEWESLLLLGQSGVPQVVAMRVVESGKRRKLAATPAAAGLVEPSGAAMGTQGTPCLREGIWHRSLALAALPAPAAFCRALEERQQAHRRLWARAQSLGDGPRQTTLLRGEMALGHAFAPLSQHPRACFASATSPVSGPIVVGRGATRQRA